ncbi:MAG: aminoacyl-tRNA hydrolase [Verrucomicrobia bacterium]|nr:aminoacyl-tRNA hydrolase [Verrucomicrobiota bacterium]
MRVIAGLGNPGRQYDGTRHNVGFVILDHLASRHGGVWKSESRFCAHTAAVNIHGQPVILCKPQTYMNLSGESVGALIRFYKFQFNELAVVLDEFQLPLGTCKLSVRGSSGGHNGLSSILQHCGSDFIRYRIGIAPATKPVMTMADFVLARFDRTEATQLTQHLPALVDGLEYLIQNGLSKAMNLLNQRPQTNESKSNS